MESTGNDRKWGSWRSYTSILNYWWIPCVAAKNIIKISDMGGKNCWLTMVYYQ